MKTNFVILCGSLAACAALSLHAADTVRGGSAQGGSATGGSVTGGSVTGGTATGGSATGGSVTGGSATGGSATGGSVTGSSISSGTSTPGTATSGTVGAGTATAVADGREIRVTAPGSVSVNVNGADANISVAGQSLMVNKTKLLLDGKELGDIPAETKKVEVLLEKDMLSIKGDGKELARAKVVEP